MKNMLLVFFIIFSATLAAQTDDYSDYNRSHHYHNYYQNQKLQWGDYYYQNSFKGLGSLMADLKKLDPELSKTLEPEYKKLQNRQQDAGVILGAGSVLSLGMFLGGAGILISSANDTHTGQFPNWDKPTGGTVLTIGGAVVGWIAVLVYFNKKVKQTDIFHFTNQFNQHSTGEKLKISMLPSLRFDNGASAGFSFTIGF